MKPHYGQGYRKILPLNTCNQPYNQDPLTRVYPRKTNQKMAWQDYPLHQPNTGVPMNYADSFCNQGQCRGPYPVSFGKDCAVPPSLPGSCYPYSSILQLISKIIKWKNSGVEYDTLGYMFYNAFMLYYTPDQSTPYFITDYTYAILQSILVGNYATAEYNNGYPRNYYDTVIDSLKRLQYRITDYDFRFQFNGQLCCYLVQSIPDPPENLVTNYAPGNNSAQPTLSARGSLY